MLNHSVTVFMVSKILGHAKPSISLDVYGHLYHEMQNETVRIIDELITPIPVDIAEKASQDVSR